MLGSWGRLLLCKVGILIVSNSLSDDEMNFYIKHILTMKNVYDILSMSNMYIIGYLRKVYILYYLHKNMLVYKIVNIYKMLKYIISFLF